MDLNFKKNRKKIKICYWNVHGVKSQIIGDKLLDQEFLGKLRNSDIVSLSELHTEKEDIFLPGYRLLKQKIRKKVHKGPKIGGGIAVFVREDFCDLIHVVPNTNENSIWIRIKKGSEEGGDVFIGSYYVSPETKKSKHNLFDILNEEAKQFRDRGEVIIQGDFNARTGQREDFIRTDRFFENIFDGFPADTRVLPPRNSEDGVSNARGEELLDFCKTNEFAIVNGRKVGDIFGRCTSHQYNGSSAIDYLLTTTEGFSKVSSFEVGDYVPWLSDHSPIFADVGVNVRQREPGAPIALHGRDQGYMWDDECEGRFKALLLGTSDRLETADLSVRPVCLHDTFTETIDEVLISQPK